MQLDLIQSDRHCFGYIRRYRTIIRKQTDIARLTIPLVENGNGLSPRLLLAVVDLPTVPELKELAGPRNRR